MKFIVDKCQVMEMRETGNRPTRIIDYVTDAKGNQLKNMI